MSNNILPASPKFESSFKKKNITENNFKIENEMDLYINDLVKNCNMNESDSSSLNSDCQTLIISEIEYDTNDKGNHPVFGIKSKISEILKDSYKTDFKKIRTNIYHKLISRLNRNNQNGQSNHQFSNNNSGFSSQNGFNKISVSAKNSPRQSK